MSQSWTNKLINTHIVHCLFMFFRLWMSCFDKGTVLALSLPGRVPLPLGLCLCFQATPDQPQPPLANSQILFFNMIASLHLSWASAVSIARHQRLLVSLDLWTHQTWPWIVWHLDCDLQFWRCLFVLWFSVTDLNCASFLILPVKSRLAQFC